MRVDKGQFQDKRVRQALALTLDRDAMIQQLFKGKGKVANDHVIFELYPYFDSSVPQRTRNIDQAKQLLSDAGAAGLKADLHRRRRTSRSPISRRSSRATRRKPGSR